MGLAACAESTEKNPDSRDASYPEEAGGSGTATGTAGGDDQATAPAEVAGAFLTMDLDPKATPSLILVDVTVMGPNGPLPLAGLAPTGELVDGNGSGISSFPIDPTTSMGSVAVTSEQLATDGTHVTLTPSGGQPTVLSANFSAFFAPPLASLDNVDIFDFGNYTSGPAFTAASFCNASGPLSGPSAVAGGLSIPVGQWSGDTSVNIGNGTCFENLSQKYGSSPGDFFATAESAGPYMAAGPTGPSGPACTFAVVADGKTGVNSRLVVIPNGQGESPQAVRTTVELSRCAP